MEVRELTNALGSITRQYAHYVSQEAPLGRAAEAKLLVWSVAPGSIDIGLLPDWHAVAGLFATLHEPLTFVVGFATKLKQLLDAFRSSHHEKESTFSAADCSDAINIAAPIANHGGHQNIVIINGSVIQPIMTMDADDARKVMTHAHKQKGQLLLPGIEIRQRVPLIWSQLDRDEGKTAGQRSPDKATIEEIDPDPKPVFFTDEMLFLKHQMIGDEENPWGKVYFVDVEVSRANGRVVSYRVVAFHGKDDLEA